MNGLAFMFWKNNKCIPVICCCSTQLRAVSIGTHFRPPNRKVRMELGIIFLCTKSHVCDQSIGSNSSDYQNSGWLDKRVLIFRKVFSRMTSAEKLCLNWKSFQENINSSFRELRSDNDFLSASWPCAASTHSSISRPFHRCHTGRPPWMWLDWAW